jgi:hypothetical protein
MFAQQTKGRCYAEMSSRNSGLAALVEQAAALAESIQKQAGK